MEAGSSNGDTLAVAGEGVSFRFGSKKGASVLNELDISVKQGVIYGLLGPSGCGKTTLLRCIVGRLKPSSGTIKIFGRLPGEKGNSVPGPGVGFMPQELALYSEITTEETLMYFGRLYQMQTECIKERISFLTDFLDIPDKTKQIKHLSGGQQRRVSFAAALIHKPPLLILDEPTVGVDPLLRKSIWNHLFNLAAHEGISIIITTHYVEEARQAQVVGFMRDGHLLAENNPEHIISRYQVQTLEDVFLKLCVKDSEVEADTTSFEEEGIKMLPRGVMQAHDKYSTKTAVNGSCPEQSKTALLDSTPGIVAIVKQDLHTTPMSSVWNRMRALVTKNFVRLKRNIPLLLFELFVPAFQVIIFCIFVGGELFDIPMAVVNLETDPSGKSNMFLQHIDPVTIRQKNYSSLKLAFESVQRGENWGVVSIGPVFTDSMTNRFLEGIYADNITIDNSTVKIFLDMSNQQIASTIYKKIMDGFDKFAKTALQQYNWNDMIAQPPAILAKPIFGDLDPDFTEYMAPGMILGMVYIMAVGLSAMPIIIEKKQGLLDRSWIAGVRSWEVLFSILFTLFLVMLVQVALVLVFTFMAFSIPCRGPMVWVVIAVLLAGMEGMAYGLFVSSIVDDENIAVMIAMGSLYPNMIMSGILWPIEAMPHYLRNISYCLPMTVLSNTVRSILSRGWTITDNGIWAGYLIAVAWIIPMILLASFFFRIRK